MAHTPLMHAGLTYAYLELPGSTRQWAIVTTYKDPQRYGEILCCLHHPDGRPINRELARRLMEALNPWETRR